MACGPIMSHSTPVHISRIVSWDETWSDLQYTTRSKPFGYTVLFLCIFGIVLECKRVHNSRNLQLKPVSLQPYQPLPWQLFSLLGWHLWPCSCPCRHSHRTSTKTHDDHRWRTGPRGAAMVFWGFRDHRGLVQNTFGGLSHRATKSSMNGTYGTMT
jgi:hypothetical protein